MKLYRGVNVKAICKKVCILLLVVVCSLFASACGCNSSSSGGGNSPSVTDPETPSEPEEKPEDKPEEKPEEKNTFNPDEDSPYKVEDVVKTDLMWDTEELFSRKVETMVVDLDLGDGITTFMFKGEAYPEKDLTETWVYAAVGVPKTAKPVGGYPAIVLVHGGTGRVFEEWISYWTDKGFVALALDMYSNGLAKEGEEIVKTVNPLGGPNETRTGSLYDGVEVKENSWVYHSVSNIVLCNNLLREREDVNKTQIGITGISWGAVAVNIVAGVDKRFNAFAPVYGSGYLYEDSFWLDKGSFGGSKFEQWIAMYDPSSYLPYATKPILFVSGINDNCFSVEARAKSYALPKGKVFYSQREGLWHGWTWGQTYEIVAFMRHVLLGEDTMSMLNGVTKDGDTVTLNYTEKKFDKVYITYTTSTDADSHKWVFSTTEVKEENGNYTFTLPSGVTAFVFETYHDSIAKDYRLSTCIFIAKSDNSNLDSDSITTEWDNFL